ncbi:MAG: hypothetical protein F6K09_03955 [Merismopedia sp. SIO2A8]|nr:hypothetical protein [Merismopedia sp. SIO2A8]
MDLQLTTDTFSIVLDGTEQLWAFHFGKTIYVSLTQITHVQTGAPEGIWEGIRAPSTFVPGLIRAGTYYTTRGREFWYVTRQTGPLDQTPTLTLDLKPDEYYKRIVVSASDSEGWGDRLRTQIREC